MGKKSQQRRNAKRQLLFKQQFEQNHPKDDGGNENSYSNAAKDQDFLQSNNGQQNSDLDFKSQDQIDQSIQLKGQNSVNPGSMPKDKTTNGREFPKPILKTIPYLDVQHQTDILSDDPSLVKIGKVLPTTTKLKKLSASSIKTASTPSSPEDWDTSIFDEILEATQPNVEKEFESKRSKFIKTLTLANKILQKDYFDIYELKKAISKPIEGLKEYFDLAKTFISQIDKTEMKEIWTMRINDDFSDAKAISAQFRDKLDKVQKLHLERVRNACQKAKEMADLTDFTEASNKAKSDAFMDDKSKSDPEFFKPNEEWSEKDSEIFLAYINEVIKASDEMKDLLHPNPMKGEIIHDEVSCKDFLDAFNPIAERIDTYGMVIKRFAKQYPPWIKESRLRGGFLSKLTKNMNSNESWRAALLNLFDTYQENSKLRARQKEHTAMLKLVNTELEDLEGPPLDSFESALMHSKNPSYLGNSGTCHLDDNDIPSPSFVQSSRHSKSYEKEIVSGKTTNFKVVQTGNHSNVSKPVLKGRPRLFSDLYKFKFDLNEIWNPSAEKAPRNDLNIITFNGENICDYEEWAEQVHAKIILNKQLSPENKQLNLLQYLEGDAKDSVFGLKPRSLFNLVQTLETLDEEFGNPTTQKGALFRRLKSLPSLDLRNIDSLVKARNAVKNLQSHYKQQNQLSCSKMEADAILSQITYTVDAQNSYDEFLRMENTYEESIHLWMKWIEPKIMFLRKHAFDSAIAGDLPDKKNAKRVKVKNEPHDNSELDQDDQDHSENE